MIEINKILPIASFEQEISDSLNRASNLIIIGETGSGKTTQIPLIILKTILQRYSNSDISQLRQIKLKGAIAITQPRRIAATSVAEFVSKQIGEEIGNTIGYKIRFHDVTSDETKIIFMTDGILLREAQVDPLLLRYSAVMVDEAHERNINSDFLIGLLLEIQERRRKQNKTPLQIIMSSATLEKDKFLSYLDKVEGENYEVIEIPGRMFPVTKSFSKFQIEEYEYTAAKIVKTICENYFNALRTKSQESVIKNSGDILIFMPGKREIERTKQEIINLPKYREYGLEIITIHADLPIEEQNKIFSQTNKRKIVIATNIAETSITVPGIVHVIDSGLIKQMDFNPKVGLHSLVTKFHARKGLIQRMGRAGRVRDGYYYGLFTEESFETRDEFPMPEILRSALSQVILVMKKIGIKDIYKFKYIDTPKSASIKQALNELNSIKAIDKRGNITDKGLEIVTLPIEPKLANLILEANKEGVLEDIITIASFLELKPLIKNLNLNDFIELIQNRYPEIYRYEEIEKLAMAEFKIYKQKAFKLVNPESDILTFLKVWDLWVENDYSEEWAKDNYLSYDVLEEAKNIREEMVDIIVNLDLVNNKKNNFAIKKYHQRNTSKIENVLIKSFGYNILAKFRGRFGSTSGIYRNIVNNSTGIRLHGSSVVYDLKPSFLLAYEVIEINEIDSLPKLSAKVLHSLSANAIKRFFPQELRKFEKKAYKKHTKFKPNFNRKRNRGRKVRY